jgi:RHH-type transcriptional regulator, rel operon repressor / antitoxin RelB
MLAIRLPQQLEHKLENLAKRTGRSKNYYVRQAIEDYLEDYEDYMSALARLEKKNPRISIDEMERRLDDLEGCLQVV